MYYNSFHYNSFLNIALFGYIYLPERNGSIPTKSGSIFQNRKSTTCRPHCNKYKEQEPRIHPNHINQPLLGICLCSVLAFSFISHYFKTSTLLLKNNYVHFIHNFQVLGYDALIKCWVSKHFQKELIKLPSHTLKCRIFQFLCGLRHASFQASYQNWKHQSTSKLREENENWKQC